MALDNPEKKMSKSADSYLNSIQLLDDPDLILKKFKRAVTDSENNIRYDRENKPGISNLLDIHSAMTGESVESLVKRYRNKGYGHLKIDTAEAVIQELKPLQDRFRDVMDSGEVQRALARGASAPGKWQVRRCPGCNKRWGWFPNKIKSRPVRVVLNGSVSAIQGIELFLEAGFLPGGSIFMEQAFGHSFVQLSLGFPQQAAGRFLFLIFNSHQEFFDGGADG